MLMGGKKMNRAVIMPDGMKAVIAAGNDKCIKKGKRKNCSLNRYCK